MPDARASIENHYGFDGLTDRILAALQSEGHDTANLTVEMLNLVSDALRWTQFDEAAGRSAWPRKGGASPRCRMRDRRLESLPGSGLWMPDQSDRPHVTTCRGGDTPQ